MKNQGNRTNVGQEDATALTGIVHPSADCVVGWTTLSASRPGPLGDGDSGDCDPYWPAEKGQVAATQSADGCTPVCRLCGRYLALLGRPIRITIPAVTVAPTALVGSLIRLSNLPHSLQRGVH